MKFIKSLLLFVFSIVLVSSCFDPPEFPNTPKIDFRGLYFRDLPSGPDSLVLTIGFQDGDGDLGLSATDIGSPFNEHDFFLDNLGKIATVRSQKFVKDDEEKNIPAFSDPFKCQNYIYDTIYVSEAQKDFIDKTFNITDTVLVNGTRYYEILDTFFIEKNPYYYNIEVSFWLLKTNGDPSNDSDYQEFDWGSLFPWPLCGESFNGRFPVLSDNGKRTPLEGNLVYAMKSTGFNVILGGGKIFKLKVLIRDRALHESNGGKLLETPHYTLDKIRK